MFAYNKLDTINSIDLYKSKNEVLHTFVKLFTTELRDCTPLAEKYPQQVSGFLAASSKYIECLTNHSFSELTERIHSVDSWNDKKWTAARYLIIAAADSPVQGRREAAKRIKRIFDSFGKVRYMSLTEQSGAMSSLCHDILQNHHADAELIGIVPLIEDMQQTNDEFLATFDERVDAKAEHEVGETLKTKNDLIVRYRGLIMLANADIYVNGMAGYETFVKNTNQLIRDFRPMVGQKPSTGEGGEDSAEGEGEEIKFRYITFMNGEVKVKRFRCEVGKAIPESKIPAAPEGMQWQGIPELMPDEDVTVNAVPEETQPQEFTPEQLREFPVLPALYGSVEEITNPNSLISPFNPLSQNYKLSNLLPGTPAPTEGEVPAGKSKVKFEREEEEEETRRIRRELRRLLHSEGSEFSEFSEDAETSEDAALLDTKPFYVWYDTGLPIQNQGYLPPLLPGFHWYDLEHVLDSEHYTVRAVRNTSPEEGEQEDEDLTAGMLWPSDRPAPDGWCVVTFRPAHGEPITKLYRQGATIVSQGFLPENEEGYIWSGIYSKLNSSTHTAEEVEE